MSDLADMAYFLWLDRQSASVAGTGTAKTAQPVEGEACQNGPQGDALDMLDSVCSTSLYDTGV